jgi:dTDP-glucose 4,6-dehydratase
MALQPPTLLVTGGAGFIGATFVRQILRSGSHRVVTLDKLTYAGNLDSLGTALEHPDHEFIRGDVADEGVVREVFERHRPDAVVHLAAESHVDRSIDAPAEFLRTNVLGTYCLLQEARRQWERDRDPRFRFLHVSTDEVFGSLGATGRFTATSPYDPSSPYAATKASADHLVRAWRRTYGLPTLITNCSNNYGPRQYPEKLIPTVILAAATGRPIPVYGEGRNVRDWLFVEDHARALEAVLAGGVPGETYLIGAEAERSNLALVESLCDLVDRRLGLPDARSTRRLITFVTDRPGHDLRYALDAGRTVTELGWRPTVALDDGLARTVDWYLEHSDWVERVRAGAHHLVRLGLGAGA